MSADARGAATGATVVAVVGALALGACGGGGTGPDGGGRPGMSARIDGVNWQAATTQALNFAAGQFEIAGVATHNSISLVLAHIAGPGTFPLGVSAEMVGGHGNVTHSPAVLSDTSWTTNWVGFGGEVVISTLSATRIAGTFHFNAGRSVVGSTRTVTAGAFDLPVTGAGGLAAGNTGHRFVGDIQGPFQAYTTVFSWPAGSGPTLSITAGSGMTNLSISVENVPGTGTYALDTLPPLRSITVVGRPGTPSGQWTSARPGGSGSVTVTSVTAQRIQGTFAATVAASAGGATGSFPVSGTFDMGRGGP